MRAVKNMVRHTRRVGSNEPYRVAAPHRVAVKPVYLGNHAPGDHFTAVSHQWVPEKELVGRS